ncbi:MAG: hypothetical protein RIB84_21050 [Sneathiellaceae bacterium]
MTFVRSPQGLSNLYLFSNVDYVVFTEGGPSTFSVHEAARGEFNQAAGPDVHFWAQVFYHGRRDLRVHVRGLGSKTTLNEIAKLVESGDASNICVAMDSDYSQIFDEKFKSKYILYTYGYSWENDLFEEELLISVLDSIGAYSNDTSIIDMDISEAFSCARRELLWLTYADILLFSARQSLFDRKKPESSISDFHTIPRIQKSRLKTLLKTRRTFIGKFRSCGKFQGISVEQHCPGKVLLLFTYRVMQYIIKRYSKFPIPHKKYAVHLLFSHFYIQLASNHSSTKIQYYLELTKTI